MVHINRLFYKVGYERNTWLDFVEESYISILRGLPGFGYVRDDVEIFNVRDLLVQRCELVEMGSKETKGVDLRRDVSRVNSE